jgi:hypothetical protein
MPLSFIFLKDAGSAYHSEMASALSAIRYDSIPIIIPKGSLPKILHRFFGLLK